MKQLFEKLYAHEVLGETEAFELMAGFTSGALGISKVSSLLSVYCMRSPATAELKGFRSAMMQACVVPDIDAHNAIDIVGTGGDGKHTFNISTLSAVVTAAAGVPVVKHGNYAAGSVSGSSDVLEYLGYRFTSDSAVLQRQMDKHKICFLHAPFFHPAMKHAAVARKELGVRTFFNLLGPLLNPAQPGACLLGVSRLSMIRSYQYLLEDDDVRYSIIHSLDGYDELSLTGRFKLVTRTSEQLLSPADYGFKTIPPAALDAGGSLAAAAEIFIALLQGKATAAQQQVVIANSGLAIHCARPESSLPVCFAMAEEALQSGKAYHLFKDLIQ